MNEHKRVWKAILNQTKPFCITDLFNRLEKQSITDKKLIMQVLNEQFEAGLVSYGQVMQESEKEFPEQSIYAFYVT